MKIACIVPYTFLPATSGGQKLIAGFCEYLGVETELHVFGTPENDAALVKNYSFSPFLKSSRVRYTDILLFLKLKKIISEKEIETVIIEHPYLGWLGWMLKKSCKIQLIYHTHNIEFERFRSIGKPWWGLLKMYERWSLQKADAIFCITEEDKKGMIKQLHITPSKCIVVPYGIKQETAPDNKVETKASVCSELQIDATATLLFFNGVLNYKPNLDALKVILNEINPKLIERKLNYKLLVAGKHLPDQYNQLKEWSTKNIYYLGFVSDIDRYTLATDILLNPVTSGGGIKTKMIEALGLNTAVISTVNGAAGVHKEDCGEKLKIVADVDWKHFVEEIIKTAKNTTANIPMAFYEQFSWKHIVKNILPVFKSSQKEIQK